MSPVGVVPPATTSASNSIDRAVASVRSTVTVRRPAFSTPPTGAITNAVTPSAAVAFTNLETPARSEPASAMIPILRPSIRPGSAKHLHQRGRDGDVLGGFAFRGGQTETGGNLLAQVGVDVGQYLEFAFLDRLLVDLAQLEGESFDDVGLFDRAQAAVEHCRLREVVVERGRLRAHRRAFDHPRRLHVPAVLLIGELRLVPVDAVGMIGRHAGVDRGLMHAVAEHVVDRAVRPVDGQLGEIRVRRGG